MSISTSSSIEQLAINTIRTLSMDAVQQANSGHPGTPMALAPAAYALWNRHLRYDPNNPQWPARDRFVLSCGHASMLLYSMLHLSGVREPDDSLAISLDDIRKFRQLGSPCAGHPEYGDAAGIETTTGPLGQGVGNSVGMAAAAKWRSARYDRPGFDLFDYNVYAFASDGDLMEGVGNEAASLAGHLKLANLCWLYDDNRITIEGDTKLAYGDDAGQKFEALGWRAIHVEDANDLDSLDKAYAEFLATDDRPTLIVLRSVIAWGSPNKANTHGAHGSPLGEDEIRLTKEVYGWPQDEKFLVPEEVTAHFAEGVGARGQAARESWEAKFSAYRQAHPELASEIDQQLARELPAGWDSEIPTFEAGQALATRKSSGAVLNAIAGKVPWLLGGSADLAPSTNTLLKGEESFAPGEYAGRNFHFGVREHAMAAACNGMSLSGVLPYGATFFVFSDYLRPSMRLSSIMHQPVMYVFTHDSIGLGEDGPTHQPIEHLAACRAIPGLIVARPGDANEVAEIYRALLPIKDQPRALVLTRQSLPTLDRAKYAAASGAARGAYVLADSGAAAELVLMATGSELQLCVEAYEALATEGRSVRLVSFPSWELFEMQDAAYQAEVLPPGTKRIAVEAGVVNGWERYLGAEGRFLGLQEFGRSAPYKEVYAHFGLTAERVVETGRELLG